MQELTGVKARQAEEFCSLTDSLAGVDYAESMVGFWYGDDRMKEAWLYVGEISQFWNLAECLTNSGSNRILMISDVLGRDVALKLYRRYLNQCESCGIERTLLIPLDDLARIVCGSSLSDEDGRTLYALTRELSERKGYLDGLTKKKGV